MSRKNIPEEESKSNNSFPETQGNPLVLQNSMVKPQDDSQAVKSKENIFKLLVLNEEIQQLPGLSIKISDDKKRVYIVLWLFYTLLLDDQKTSISIEAFRSGVLYKLIKVLNCPLATADASILELETYLEQHCRSGEPSVAGAIKLLRKQINELNYSAAQSLQYIKIEDANEYVLHATTPSSISTKEIIECIYSSSVWRQLSRTDDFTRLRLSSLLIYFAKAIGKETISRSIVNPESNQETNSTDPRFFHQKSKKQKPYEPILNLLCTMLESLPPTVEHNYGLDRNYICELIMHAAFKNDDPRSMLDNWTQLAKREEEFVEHFQAVRTAWSRISNHSRSYIDQLPDIEIQTTKDKTIKGKRQRFRYVLRKMASPHVASLGLFVPSCQYLGPAVGNRLTLTAMQSRDAGFYVITEQRISTEEKREDAYPPRIVANTVAFNAKIKSKRYLVFNKWTKLHRQISDETMEEVIQNFQKELLQRHPQYPQYKEILYGIETHPNPSPTIFSADSLLQGSNIMELEAIDRHIHIWRRTFDSAKVRLFCTKNVHDKQNKQTTCTCS
ncbi:hypothetical protein AYM02_04465 [Coxiella burnetii]|uniref:CBU_1493 family Dot/Icm T4SS effector n=1 Tax=Coxiella burnetii TaxID=777 RepID=UPI00016101F6|nr:CBU_1493 family Dot/Icm T4SS effector [Coxiella burnetii]ABX77642.1 hypothetical protein COXBURSA331_A1673 [Coxiella burnetii RSA 331]AML48608.1 hypothetical protein AUR58_04995 [Coxiella burnetii]AML54593.1 hypothetical protein AYM38_04410 [Coxiella burnetii]ATN68556.1 hypothetical protein AYM00_04660 [Coxiella burnetii]ATN70483.1 hypothetical protein AYM02_04465 [Coxiella burnetii]